MKGKLIRKKLCVLGLVAASVSAGVATPLALSATQAQEVQAETNSSTKAKKVAVKSVKLNKTKANLTAGKTLKLTATVSPSNATNKAVTWSSSNTKVATVDKNGNVKGIKAGKAKITVKTKDGGKTAACTITVKAAKQTGKTGWYKENGGYKYYKNGEAYTGWHKMGKAEGEKTEHWSYFGKDGKIYTGWHKMGKAEGEKKAHWSYFGSNGWLRTGWVQFGKGTSEPDGNKAKHWSYFGGDGWLRTGWQWMGKGTKNPDGNSAKHKSYFGSNGWLRTGNHHIGSDQYSFNNRGWLQKYFYVNGKKFTGICNFFNSNNEYLSQIVYKNGKKFTGTKADFPKECYNATFTYNGSTVKCTLNKIRFWESSNLYYKGRCIDPPSINYCYKSVDIWGDASFPKDVVYTYKIAGDTYKCSPDKNGETHINLKNNYKTGSKYTVTIEYGGKKTVVTKQVISNEGWFGDFNYCDYHVTGKVYHAVQGDEVILEDSRGGRYTKKITYTANPYNISFYTNYKYRNYSWLKFTFKDKYGQIRKQWTWNLK